MDQINLTDEESRIMPAPGGGFDQAYNAQAAVDTESLLSVGQALTQATNDKQQVEPMLAELQALAESVGSAQTLLADTGYFSEANVNACVKAGLEPLIAIGREAHHWPLDERLREPPAPPPVNADALTQMRHALKTPEGRARYARRKCTVEPVFGHHKAGDALPPVPAAQCHQGERRVESRLHGVEHKADGGAKRLKGETAHEAVPNFV